MPFRTSCHAFYTSGQRTLAASAPENGDARAWYFYQRRRSLCRLDVLAPPNPLATNVRLGQKQTCAGQTAYPRKRTFTLAYVGFRPIADTSCRCTHRRLLENSVSLQRGL